MRKYKSKCEGQEYTRTAKDLVRLYEALGNQAVRDGTGMEHVYWQHAEHWKHVDK